MEILVLAIQLLSVALLSFGAGLCVWLVQREREEVEAERQARLQPEKADPERPGLGPDADLAR